MRVREKLVDVVYRARDLYRMFLSSDNFGKPDLLGRYFEDGGSYYIDFRGTAKWSASLRENVPVVYVPSLSWVMFFPMTVIHYGLGSIDEYFASGDPVYREQARHVASWLLAHCGEHGYYDNHFREINTDPGITYYSNNSAMTQGQAVSFLLRVARHGLLQGGEDAACDLAMRLYRNMKLPLEQGGATLYRNGRVYLCEYCRADDYVVLNGWIFALFGLFDYVAAFDDQEARAYLQATLDTLAGEVGGFVVPHDNWSYYDNGKRYCSPTYHVTHINQLEALFRLTGRRVFAEARGRLMEGNTRLNRLKCVAWKVIEKLRDPHRYVTDRVLTGEDSPEGPKGPPPSGP